ncbi:MAG: CBS domain-containing protein [Armatimonadota bacterium]
MQLLLDHSVSCLPVVDDDGRMLGLIIEYDTNNIAMNGEVDRTRVEEAMAQIAVSFASDHDLETILIVSQLNAFTAC